MREKVLAVFLLSLLLPATTQALCLLEINLLCGILAPVCNLTNLLALLCWGDPVISLSVASGNYVLSLNTVQSLASLSVTTSGSASLSLNLDSIINITGNLLVSGVAVVTVTTAGVVTVLGNTQVTAGATLQLAGRLTTYGTTQINGLLKFNGAQAPSTGQTAWLTALNPVTVTGTASTPAIVQGNGGIIGSIIFTGYTKAGVVNTASNIYVSQNVKVDTASQLQLAGNITTAGTAQVSGKLNLTGTLVQGSAQKVWVRSLGPPVVVNGTTTQPAAVTGNGGVDGSVEFYGESNTGNVTTITNVYITEDFNVTLGATLRLAGNVTVAGLADVAGRLHFAGTISAGKPQNAWIGVSSALTLQGTESQYAALTGNGGVKGDVICVDYVRLAAGNSPGVHSYAGNLVMGSSSYMEIEVESPNSFDRYEIAKNFTRNGALYVYFSEGYVANTGDRFVFATHATSVGNFNSLGGNFEEIASAYGARSTSFVFDDPGQAAFCSCTVVY